MLTTGAEVQNQHSEQSFDDFAAEIQSQSEKLSYDDFAFEKRKSDYYNSQSGNLTGYDCEKCLNRGGSSYVDEKGQNWIWQCECLAIRKTMRMIESSGLKDLLEICTFDSFRTDSPWQGAFKRLATDFVTDYMGNWFFTGGQVGAGKTHLCTAIVGKLIESGKSSRYMLWRDETVQLKAIVTEGDEYAEAIGRFKHADVLYIDDFFKTEYGKPPTTADINIAFELLNYRYINKDLVTIISSERSIDDILNIDESVGSRIYQRSKKYCFVIKADKSKNYRMR